MNALSLQLINTYSPYKVDVGESKASYGFSTDYGVDYSIDFVPDDLISSDESCQLIIANLNNRKSPRDGKVKDTVMCIVEEFFNKNQSTLLYICETGDSKQTMRNRLFEYWFSTYKNRGQYAIMSSSITDEDGVVNYATIIVRNDNPKMPMVMAEFSESIHLLSQKPKNEIE